MQAPYLPALCLPAWIARDRVNVDRNKGATMGHDKTRSSVSVGDVNWDDPRLNDLLKKADGWNIDHRNPVSPQDVQIRIACGWSASSASKPARLIAEVDGTMVLATTFPLPHGEEVQVNSQTSGMARTRLGVVVQEREGHRAGDREQGLFFNWLRVRSA
jgi:hypothetical protein